MSKRDQYRVHVTALVSGWATYNIPEGDKIRHFVDGSSEVEWDLSTVRDFEHHEAEYTHTFDSEDCWGDCEIEDASSPDTRAPYPRTDDDTAPDNDDGFPF
jgi:hypothetical protein